MPDGIVLSAAARQSRYDIAVTARGLISETFHISSIHNAATPTATYTYYGLLGLRAGDVITNVHCVLSTAVAGADGTAYFGLFSGATNAKLADTGDTGASALWDTTGAKGFALTAPYTITSEGGYYVGVLIGVAFGTTQPAFRTNAGNMPGNVNSGLRAHGADTASGATLPTTANVVLGGSNFWFAVS